MSAARPDDGRAGHVTADAAAGEWHAPHGSVLPRPLSRFVGREREVREILEGLSDARLLTLTGPGGCGKTRLAWEVSARWPGEVVRVELASLVRGDMVATAVADTLGVRPLPSQAEVEAIVHHVDQRAALVVLDNAEHVLEAVRDLCHVLLARCPGVRVLATSRHVLSVAGEVDWRVPPLGLPAVADVASALGSDAVGLFVERARLVDHAFALDAGSAASVVDICRGLEGMPLAIEFAAARLRVLSLTQIAERLDDALSLSGPGRPSVTTRQRTLRGSIEWSHDLLEVEERVLLRRLGVFVDGFSLPLVEAVCASPPLRSERPVDLLEALIESSLVTVIDRGVVARYRLLETVRQFGVEQLEAAGELEALRDAHRDAMVGVAEEHQHAVLTPDQPAALAALDRDAPNLAAALDRAIETDPEDALRICIALDMWWRMRGRVRERAAAFDRALATGDRAPSALRCRALIGRAWLHGNQRELDANIALGASALAMAERLDDEELIRQALLGIANSQMNADANEARASLVRCWQLGEQSGDEWVLARCALTLAFVAWYQQDVDNQRRWTAGAEERLTRLGDRGTRALLMVAEAGVRYPRLELDDATRDLRAAVDLAREVSDPFAEYCAMLLLALGECTAGRAHDASVEAERIRDRVAAMGGWVLLVWASLISAIARAAVGDPDGAAALLRAIVAGEVGVCRMPQVWARIELAEVLRLAGDPDAAGHAQAARSEADYLGNPWLVARAQMLLGRLSALEGRWVEADQLHHQALDAIIEHGLDLELPGMLEALAEVAEARRGAEHAGRLLAAASALRSERGPVAWPAQRAEVEALSARVGPGEHEPPTDVYDVVAWVRRSRGRRGRPKRGWDSLTPTELVVVHHATAGCTNPQIATAMFISHNTVKSHLAHVFDKLNVSTRSELAGIGARHHAPGSADPASPPRHPA